MSHEEQRAIEDALARESWDGVTELQALYDSLDESEKLEPLGQQLAGHIFSYTEEIRLRALSNARRGVYVPRSTEPLPPMPDLTYEDLQKLIESA